MAHTKSFFIVFSYTSMIENAFVAVSALTLSRRYDHLRMQNEHFEFEEIDCELP